MHNIGKVEIPAYMLLKPAKLPDEEFNIIKKHIIIEGNTIESAIQHIQHKNSFLDIAKNFTYSHLKSWDGNGDPYSLKEKDIPHLQG